MPLVPHPARGAAVDHLVAHAFGALGATAVELTVLAVNEQAIRLYRRIGFETDEVRRGARTGPDGTSHDVLIMTLDRNDAVLIAEGVARPPEYDHGERSMGWPSPGRGVL